MKDGFIKVAAANIQVRVADLAANAEAIIQAIDQAAELQVRLLVLPELCLTGATCGDLFRQKALQTGTLEALNRVRAATAGKNLLVFVGLPVAIGGSLYNCAAALYDGRLLGLTPKGTCAPSGDGRWFAPGPAEVKAVDCLGAETPFGKNLVYQASGIPDFTVACELGEDLEAADQPGVRHALAGARVLVNLAAARAQIGANERRRLLLTGQSARLCCGYILAGTGRGESTTDQTFSGHCLVLENGKLLAEKTDPAPGMIVTDLDLQRLAVQRDWTGGFGGGGEGYTFVPFQMLSAETVLTRRVDPVPFMPQGVDVDDRCEQILSIQAEGLRQRLTAIHCDHAVLGLSGGLDSTLALLVTVRTFDALGLPRTGIQALTLPCFGTTARTKSNAWKMAQLLGVSIREIGIGDTVRAHFKDIGLPENDRSVTFENAQARERTQVLFDVANMLGGLVVGTGDLSELALGWATFNGDHMSSYDVNGGLPKTVIRHVVRHYAKTCGDEALAAVLQDVLDTPVSPELLPPSEGAISQKTEELVGPYDLHDFYLYYAVRWGFAPKKVYRLALTAFAGTYEPKVLKYWLKNFYRRFFAMQFKRNCLSDGPKIGSVDLSPRGEWVMPSDAAAALWLSELEKIAE